ncbi:MAG: hypothetical protein IJS94_02690, partial [Clostridia bacterium]|nr:hypothetical protein [Clostridia bacterium]
KPDGVVCIIMNSEIKESDMTSGDPLTPQFEINFETEKLNNTLRETFKGFEVIKDTLKEQRYEVPRGSISAVLQTKAVTFAAKSVTVGEVMTFVP